MIIKQEIKEFEQFEGTAKKITLVSSPCYFLLPPNDDSPKTQKLSLSATGQVSFSSTDFQFPPEKISSGEWRKKTLDKEVMNRLLEKIAEPFRSYDLAAYITDVGDWEITITNTEDKKFKYSGSLNDDTFPNAEVISELIRETLMMSDLLCFDGGKNN